MSGVGEIIGGRRDGFEESRWFAVPLTAVRKNLANPSKENRPGQEATYFSLSEIFDRNSKVPKRYSSSASPVANVLTSVKAAFG
jgi:hypothetical protein